MSRAPLAKPADQERKDGPRAVRAHAATGPERERLWAGFSEYKGWADDIDAVSIRRSIETAVVVLEPRGVA